MKKIILFLAFLPIISHAKCVGFDDFKPHYCVKIKVLNAPEPYKDGCIFEYEILNVNVAEPVKREYPHWKAKFENEKVPHVIAADKNLCETIKKGDEFRGISSQYCHDSVSREAEFIAWIKGKVGIKVIKPNFHFSEREIVNFHDKGSLEVFCSEIN